MTDKLTQDVHEIVDAIFKQKEEATMRKETEEALNKSAEMINELSESLEAKDVELSNLESKNEELELTVSELSDKVKNLEENLASAKADFESKEKELTNELELSRKELDNIKKDQIAKARFEDLNNKGVSATTEQSIKDQIVKIREMNDEEFKSYKTERIELRKSVVAELEASDKKESALDKEVKADAKEIIKDGSKLQNYSEKSSEEDAEAKLENEEEAIANSEDSIDPMKAVAAMLNMETIPTNDVISRYKALGAALAENVKNKSKK